MLCLVCLSVRRFVCETRAQRKRATEDCAHSVDDRMMIVVLFNDATSYNGHTASHSVEIVKLYLLKMNVTAQEYRKYPYILFYVLQMTSPLHCQNSNHNINGPRQIAHAYTSPGYNRPYDTMACIKKQ